MRNLTLFALACLAASAGATQRHSFLSVDQITGVSAVGSNADPVTGKLRTWTIGLDSGGGTFKIGTATYHITQIIGFYQLDRSHTFTRTGTDDGNWDWDFATNDGGNIFGWKGSAQAARLNVGESRTFTYGLGGLGDFETLGFHVTTVELFPGTSGYTGNITEDGAAPPVPEPATMGLIAAALGVAARKRRK